MSAGQRASLEFLLDNLVWLLLVVVLIIFSLTIPNYFQFAIFTNIIEDSTYVGVMAIGLAIVVVYFRNRGSIQVEDVNLMKG